MGMHIGIAGAGLLGRLAAWVLSRQGHRVEVFDPGADAQARHDGQGAAGFTAAGMLSPVAERESADAALADLGWQSIEHWTRVCDALGPMADGAPLMVRQGSLLVAHGSDLGSARRVLARLDDGLLPQTRRPQALTPQALAQSEPSLHSSQGLLHAWFLPDEAHIDTVRTLQALHDQASGVRWHWRQAVSQLTPHHLWTKPMGDAPAAPIERRFDLVMDLRGVGARPACAVRGVRGEVVWLQAPGLGLRRPVRLLHPRHRVYIVPRPNDVVLVGASEIESEDRSPVSLRSAVELMAAAHSVLPALAEARILQLDVNLRPAMPDHHPHVHHEAGLLRINGLYRHGWLLAPALLAQGLSHAGIHAHALTCPHMP
jgi:glycine oxidase